MSTIDPDRFDASQLFALPQFNDESGKIELNAGWRLNKKALAQGTDQKVTKVFQKGSGRIAEAIKAVESCRNKLKNLTDPSKVAEAEKVLLQFVNTLKAKVASSVLSAPLSRSFGGLGKLEKLEADLRKAIKGTESKIENESRQKASKVAQPYEAAPAPAKPAKPYNMFAVPEEAVTQRPAVPVRAQPPRVEPPVVSDPNREFQVKVERFLEERCTVMSKKQAEQYLGEQISKQSQKKMFMLYTDEARPQKLFLLSTEPRMPGGVDFTESELTHEFHERDFERITILNRPRAVNNWVLALSAQYGKPIDRLAQNKAPSAPLASTQPVLSAAAAANIPPVVTAAEAPARAPQPEAPKPAPLLTAPPAAGVQTKPPPPKTSPPPDTFGGLPVSSGNFRQLRSQLELLAPAKIPVGKRAFLLVKDPLQEKQYFFAAATFDARNSGTLIISDGVITKNSDGKYTVTYTSPKDKGEKTAKFRDIQAMTSFLRGICGEPLKMEPVPG